MSARNILAMLYRPPKVFPELFYKELYRISNQIWTKAVERKSLLTPRHSLNVFSERRPCKTLELVEDSKSWLPILLVLVNRNWNLTYTTTQGSRVSWLAQTGFAAFSKGVQLIGAPLLWCNRKTFPINLAIEKKTLLTSYLGEIQRRHSINV